MRDSFVFYRSFYESINDLSKKDQNALFNAICKYVFEEIEPTLTGAASAVFKLIKPQIDANNRRFENSKKGGRPKNQTETKHKPNTNQTQTKTKPNNNPTETQPKPNVNDNVNVNVNDNVNVIEKEKKEKFKKPTLEEIKAYCQERNNGIDAEYFYSFYEAKGWKIGKEPMKNWKMAIVTWEKRRREEQGQTKATDRLQVPQPNWGGASADF